MTKLTKTVTRFGRDENGATMIEYALLIGLITVGAVAVISGGGGWITEQWTTLKTNATAAPVAW